MNATPTLQELVNAVRDRGMSFRAMDAAVAKEEARRPRGMSLNYTTAAKIARGDYSRTPSDGTIRAVAFLAGVSDEVAFTAAGRKLAGPPFADELPDGVDELDPRERRAALEILRVLVAQRQELNRHADTEPARPASTAPSTAAESAPLEGEKTPPRPVRRRRSVPKPARQDDHALAASEREIEDWDTTPG